MVADRALAFGGARHAGLQILGHRLQRLVSAGEIDAAARIDERALGREQHLGGAVDVGGGRHRPRDRRGLEQLDLALFFHGLRRHLELHGTRAAASQLHEGLTHRGRDVRHLEDAPAPLGHRGDAVELVVDLVEQADVLADLLARDLPAEHEHGRRGGVGGAEAGRGIEEPRSGHDERGADVAARPRVAVRHVAGGLLVAGGDEADALLVAQGGHHAVELHAGKTEHHAHAFALKGSYEGFAAGHPGHVVTPARG